MDQVLRFAERPDYLKKIRNFIVASLTFDSANNLAFAGVRHTESAAREMLYETDDFEIAVSLRPSGAGTITLAGQVLSKDSSQIENKSARVDIVDEGDHIASCQLSNWGEFVFPDLVRGAYSLQIQLADRVLRINGLATE